MVTRKSTPRDREDARRRPDRRRGPGAGRVRAEARRHDRPPRPARRAPHPVAGRRAVVQGLRPPEQPVPGQPLHLDRRRGRPRHPRRPARSATARSCRSTPARSTTAGTATAPGRSSSASRRPRSRELVDTTRLAMMAGIAAAVPGRPPRRHLGGGRGRRDARRLRHRPPVRRPRHRHRDAPGAAGPELPDRRPRA